MIDSLPARVPEAPGQQQPGAGGHDQHAGQHDGHEAPRAGTAGRGEAGPTVVKGPEHGGGPGRVVVLQRLVVGVVDVPGGPLALQVVEGAEQEVPLLLQGGVGVGVRRAGGHLAGAHGPSPRASATRRRSSSDAATDGRCFQRRKAR